MNLGIIMQMNVVIAISSRIVLSRDKYYLPNWLWYVNTKLLILAWLSLRHMAMKKIVFSCCIIIFKYSLIIYVEFVGLFCGYDGL